MFRKWLLGLALLPLALPGVAHATLNAGDIAFVSFASRSSVIDQFDVVFLKAPDPGEQISFTTDNWSNAQSKFVTIEDTITWQNAATNSIQPGYVLNVFNGAALNPANPAQSAIFKVFDLNGNEIAGKGTITKTHGSNGEVLGIKATGDNVLAYRGTYSNTANGGAFLTGISTNNLNWAGAAGERPTPLVDGTSSINFNINPTVTATPCTGGYYNTGLRNSGSVEELQSYINNPSKWVFLDNASNTDLRYNEALYQPYGGVPTVGYADCLHQSFKVGATVTPGVSPTWTPIATATPYAPGGGTVLAAGDVAFVGLAGRGSTFADQWAVVLLADIDQGTELTFTDDNWNNSSGAVTTTENIVRWVADEFYPAGDVIQFLNSNPYQANVYKNDGTVTLDTGNGGNGHGFISSVAPDGSLSAGGSSFGLDKGGDNLFVIQGTVNSPKFITGVTFKKNWGNSTVGDLPNGTHGENALTAGTNALYLRTDGGGDASFGYFDPSTQNGNSSTVINTYGNWSGQVDSSDVDLNVPVVAVLTPFASW